MTRSPINSIMCETCFSGHHQKKLVSEANNHQYKRKQINDAGTTKVNGEKNMSSKVDQ
jgi:hypothetical protein